uniref:Endonuclease/exonuclease/phosphatase domain-containing protein n=1 Tax=Micrurus paraensis TaxID=1970185 RepID=A0A2D4KFD0_9SAUR
MDYRKDYKGEKREKKRLPKTCIEMFKEFNMTDVWRERNLDKQQYTFYSNPHKSWSRIDMAWMGGELTEEVENIEILPNYWADHNPIKITWKGKKKQNPGGH